MPDVISLEDAYGGVAFPNLNAAPRTPLGSTEDENSSPISSTVAGILPTDSGIFNTLKAAADKYGVPAQFAFALANQESGYNPKAVGVETPYGKAKGMFQYIDDTAKGMGIDPFDVAQSADAAMKQFSQRMKEKGVDFAIAAHFAGDDPKQHGKKTRQYLSDVQKRASDIQALLAEGKVPTEANIKKEAAKRSNRPGVLTLEEAFAMQEPVQSTLPPPQKPDKDEPWYQPVVDAGKNTFDAAMNRLQEELPRVFPRTPEEEEEYLRTGRSERVVLELPDGTKTSGLMATEPSIDRRLRWQQIVNEDPSQIKNVPKDLLLDIAHNSEQVRGFVANLRNPLELFTNESMPAEAVSFYANLPERARKRFDDARQVAMQENIVANPGKFPKVSVEAAQREIDKRAAAQDPTIRAQWEAIKQAAKEDPGRFGAELVNSLIADPEMLFAPIGLGSKVASTTKAVATGTRATSKASRIADRLIDAGATSGGINAAMTLVEGASMGEVSKRDIAISTALGAALGGPFGLLFRNSAEARAVLANANKAKLAGTYEDALRDAAKADVDIENTIRETSRESFEQAPAVRRLLGLDEDWDSDSFIKAYRKQVRDAFKNDEAYADYLHFVAEERMNAAAAKAEAATQEQIQADQQGLREVTTDAAYDAQRAARVSEWRENFDRAVAARDADEVGRLMSEASAENADRLYVQKLDADDAMQEAWHGDVPQIKRALGKAAQRDSIINKRGQVGEADPKTLARLAAVGAGGTLAYTLAPEDEKVATGLAGALAGLLIPAGGTVLSRLRQSGSTSIDGSLAAAPFRRIKNGLTAEEDAAARAGELAIVERAKVGDQAAMKELYTKYFPYIKRAMNNFLREAGPRLAIDSEDIAQDTMIKVFKNLESFKGDSEFSTWVHAIGKNEALNAIKKSQSRPLIEGMDSTLRFKDNDMAELGELPTKVEEVNPSTYDTPENMAILEDTQNQLSRAFEKMPEDIKLTMILKELEGFSEQEVADKLGIPLGTVKSRLSRGRKMVEEGLEKGWGAKPVGPRSQRGEVDPKLLKLGAGAGLGTFAGLYFANRSDGDPKAAAIGGAIIGAVLSRNAGALPRLVKHLYGSGSTTILEKAPPIYRRIMTMERRMLQGTHKAIDSGTDFFKSLHKLKQPDQDVVARALMTGDANVIQKVLKATGNPELIKAYRAVRETLDTMGERLAGLNLIKRTGIEYFPRMVIDKEGLFKAIGKEDRSKIEVALQQANIQSIRKQGRTLNDVEESALINKILFTDKNKSRPGWSQNRGIEEITPELQPFYAGPMESFNSYVRSAIEEIEKAKFFGKYAIKDKEGKLEYINTDTSASKMMADWIKEGKLSPEDAHEIAGLIKSRFGGGAKGEPAIIRDFKGLGNIGLLGNFWSAITQLGDIGGVLYTQGFKPTLQTLVRRTTGKKYVDMKDFGLADHISEEFARQGTISKWVKKTFKISLFSGVDKVGKTTTLNSALQRAKNSLKTEAGEDAFRKKYSDIFGDDINKLVQDIKKENFGSDIAQDYAFMELERFQPITRTSFPKFYLDHPNFRSYLWLQSWTMKQFDVLRRDGLSQMKQGNVAKGIKNVTTAALIMGSANASIQIIRDYLLGKDIEIGWGTLALNVFRNYGWSEYDARRFTGVTKEEAKEARRDGNRYARAQKAEPITTVASRVVPPFEIYEQLLQGDPRAASRMIPLVGPYLAERFKEAREFERDMQRRHPDRRD